MQLFCIGVVLIAFCWLEFVFGAVLYLASAFLWLHFLKLCAYFVEASSGLCAHLFAPRVFRCGAEALRTTSIHDGWRDLRCNSTEMDCVAEMLATH